LKVQPELEVIQFIGTDTYRAAMTSYSRSIVTMDLSRTVSEINVDFSGKSPNFPTPRVFWASADEVALGIGYRCSESKKKQNDGAIRY